MKTKQILALSLLFTFISGSIMAFELEVKEKENKTFEKKEIISTKIKLSNEKLEIKLNNGVQLKSKNAEDSLELTLEEEFFIKIKKAETETERKDILLEYKKELKENKTKKVQLLEEESKNIFDKFDSIILKLDSVKIVLDKNIAVLENKNIGLDFINPKKIELNSHLELARTEKASAWIKMQEIDFSQDKEIVLSDLGEVKEHLVTLKEEIRKTSTSIKEIISFIRGALVNLK